METPQRVEISYEDLIEGKIKIKIEKEKEITIKELMGRLQKEVNGGPAIYLRETDIGKLNYVCSEILMKESEEVQEMKRDRHISREKVKERIFFTNGIDKGSTTKAFVFWILRLYHVKFFKKGKVRDISAKQFCKLAHISHDTLSTKLNNFQEAKTKYIEENKFAIDIIKQTFNIKRTIWACI